MIASSQRKDGAYYNHATIYTSVIYIAKSLLELAVVEKQLGATHPEWQEAYTRHYASAKKAIDQLVASDGHFQTEGEHTFEDGMISCSALQMGLFALLQEDEDQRAHYRDAMLKILHSHDCLTQLRVPDARQRQGTLRFWEAQYDVMMLPNLFNSPHGWSGWRAYATYYAYLLTGEHRWLVESYNALGAFAQLIDPRTGTLHWACVSNPYVPVEQTCRPDTTYTADDVSLGNPHPHLYETKKFVVGEEYIRMISDWQGINTQDNDVHELFKFIGESFLENAFVIELEDGQLKGYGCQVSRDASGVITVTASEASISKLHYNVKTPCKITFHTAKGDKKEQQMTSPKMGWL